MGIMVEFEFTIESSGYTHQTTITVSVPEDRELLFWPNNRKDAALWPPDWLEFLVNTSAGQPVVGLTNRVLQWANYEQELYWYVVGVWIAARKEWVGVFIDCWCHPLLGGDFVACTEVIRLPPEVVRTLAAKWPEFSSPE